MINGFLGGAHDRLVRISMNIYYVPLMSQGIGSDSMIAMFKKSFHYLKKEKLKLSVAGPTLS